MSLAAQLKQKRMASGLSQKAVATALNTSDRQVRRMETPEECPGPDDELVVEYRKFLDALMLSAELPIPEDQVAHAVEVVRAAVSDCMNVAIKVLRRPHVAGHVKTKTTKITDQPLSKDKTKAVDHATSEAFKASLRLALNDPNGPFKNLTVILIDEEGERTVLRDGGPGTLRLVLFVDSCDDTSAAVRHIGGMVLVSLYLESVGFIGSVAGDLVRFTQYWRVLSQPSQAMYLDRAPLAVSDIVNRNERGENYEPKGTNLNLIPDIHFERDAISLCTYMGKPYRIKTAALESGSLFAPYDAETDDVCVSEVLSLGGSRGCTFVAEGLLHASVEIKKGFRLILDAFPGIDICQGAGGTVLDLDTGLEIDRHPHPAIEEAIKNDFASTDFYESSRIRFVAASTSELAHRLRDKILERDRV